jgi:hypothetical protein
MQVNLLIMLQWAGPAPANLVQQQITINYNNNTKTYQMLWGAGTGVYGTAGIYCNPSTKHFIQMVI